ncbi:MAG: EscR/YscR/HrcR family type III secretion system export apparatus protein [Myxococcales bacterium]|nr:EscR/YscR/HrcR family type III secretion system export apparatus protein [Myxococcales bacterium]
MTSSNPLVIVAVILAISAIPLLLMLGSSFLKSYIVLSVLKGSFGSTPIPPAPLVFAIAMLFSVVIMRPVLVDVVRAGSPTLREWLQPTSKPSSDLERMLQLARRVELPYRLFLAKHTHTNDLVLLSRLQDPKAVVPATAKEAPIWVLLPAFVLSELTEAFVFALLIVLPFLVLDLLVAHLLTAVGTTGLNPTWVSLPFKLLLFVAVDGWSLLTRGLFLSYR